MSIVKGDPIEIQNFARRLVDFTNQTRENLAHLRANLDAMHIYWDDQNYVNYKQSFDEVFAEIHRSLTTFQDEQYQRLNMLAEQYDQVKY
jgi:hypothetical protein